MLAIIAGYDTTATVLAGLFYNILSHREVFACLQQEVDNYFSAAEGSLLDSSKLTGLPYLNAVMFVDYQPLLRSLSDIFILRNESLRLGNAANILQRSTTKETGGRWLGAK